MSALYPAEKPKEEAEGLCPTWSTCIRSQPPDLFLPRIFVPKYKASALGQKLKVTILTKMAIKVDESCCPCYTKKKKKTNETTRMLISFKREALMTG